MMQTIKSGKKQAVAVKVNYHLLASFGHLNKLNGHILRSLYVVLICSDLISAPDTI